MHKAFHLRDDIDRLYVSRKEGGRGIANIENSVDASIQQHKDYKKSIEEDWSPPSETILATRGSAEQK